MVQMLKKLLLSDQSFMRNTAESKKLNTPKFDILYLGGNQLRHFGTDKKYLKNYYEQLNWLTKLSKKFRELSIVLKHHETNRNDDKLENKILKGSLFEK